MGVRLAVDPRIVLVELTGLEAVLALKRRLDIPLDQITRVATQERREVGYVKGTWLRLPGTYIPGVARYGSYGVGSRREFWAASGRGRVLVLEVTGWDYGRVVLGVDNPDGAVATISAMRR